VREAEAGGGGRSTKVRWGTTSGWSGSCVQAPAQLLEPKRCRHRFAVRHHGREERRKVHDVHAVGVRDVRVAVFHLPGTIQWKTYVPLGTSVRVIGISSSSTSNVAAPRRRSGSGTTGTGDAWTRRPRARSRWPAAGRVSTPSSRQHGCAAEERLGIRARRVAFHAAQPEQAREEVLLEPAASRAATRSGSSDGRPCAGAVAPRSARRRGAPMSPSYLGTSYSRIRWSTKVFQVSSR
jgi:hypothetical protein